MVFISINTGTGALVRSRSARQLGHGKTHTAWRKCGHPGGVRRNEDSKSSATTDQRERSREPRPLQLIFGFAPGLELDGLALHCASRRGFTSRLHVATSTSPARRSLSAAILELAAGVGVALCPDVSVPHGGPHADALLSVLALVRNRAGGPSSKVPRIRAHSPCHGIETDERL